MPSATLQQLRDIYPVEQIDVQGQALSVVRTSGRGEAMLLLPGAQGTAEVFYKQILLWGRQRAITAITYPALTDPAALANIVVGVADAVGSPAFDLVGSSYGGYLAQWVAALYPERVRRLVVGNSFADPGPVQSAEKLAALEAKTPREVKTDVMTRLSALTDGDFKQVMLDLVGVYQPDAMLQARMLAVQKAVPVPTLGVADADILLIESDDDPLITPVMREAIRRRYAGAAHCVIGGGGHYPHLLRADEYSAKVGAFLGLT